MSEEIKLKQVGEFLRDTAYEFVEAELRKLSEPSPGFPRGIIIEVRFWNDPLCSIHGMDGRDFAPLHGQGDTLKAAIAAFKEARAKLEPRNVVAIGLEEERKQQLL